MRARERFGLAVALLLVCFALIRFDLVWRWDQAIYDGLLRSWFRTPPDDIVIVAIDAESIDVLGAWPWPRGTHAELLRKLTAAGPKAVVFDVIFAEPTLTRPGDDAALAQAIRDNGRVILPVLAESQVLQAPLSETLPIPELAGSASALGHIDIELDPDGMARGVYLLAGLGQPKWPAIGLAALRLIDPTGFEQLPGLRDPEKAAPAPFTWTRDHRILLPFAGPPGSFRRVSYHRVLHDQVEADVLHDKIILIGATATGLGDVLPTPASGFSQPMPGVELHATLIDTLRSGIEIAPVGSDWRMALSLLFAIVPVLVFPLLSPRNSLLATLAMMLATAVGSLLLLRLAGLWFPPVSLLITQTLSYPLWSWRRLDETLGYLNRELEILHREPGVLPTVQIGEIGAAMAFASRVLEVEGWVLETADGGWIAGGGDDPPRAPDDTVPPTWVHDGAVYWRAIRRDGRPCRLGVRLADRRISPRARALLDQLVALIESREHGMPESRLEVVEQRIAQVQAATRRLRELGRLLSDSLAEMADGVLIADVIGQVVLANPKASVYLGRDCADRPLDEVLQAIEPPAAKTWPALYRQALVDDRAVQFSALVASRDLFVQIVPLVLGDNRPSGLIVNLTDITPLKAIERRRMELLGFLSHDLRSPLVSMLALTELARQQGIGREQSEVFIGKVENYAHHILGLAEDFLQLVRVESRTEIALREVDLIDVAQNALDKVWPQAQRKAIRIEGRFEPETAWILGNAELLVRALLNLLTNAVKYSPPGTEVVLSVRHEGGRVLCEVADQGEGIAAEDLPHLFQPFRRGANPTEPGVGLGLAFVKLTADRHGATLTVDSRPAQGARFQLAFPAVGS